MTYDVIIVLGGGIDKEGRIPDTVKERIKTAVQLWHEGKSPQIIMSGSWGFMATFIPPYTEAVAMRAYAQSLGVDERSILLEEESKDTIGNAYFCKIKFLELNKWKKVLVVTSDYHVPRARYIFEHVLGSGYIIKIIPAPSFISPLDLKKKAEFERKLLNFTTKWLSPAKPGEHVTLWDLIKKTHPGYSENPSYTTEELLKMIEES